jgi:predicted esterase
MQKSALLVAASLSAMTTFAQRNVRAWNAQGQVFIVWATDAPAPLTYSVHMSPGTPGSTRNTTRLGTLFEPEWKGSRLTLANPNARWRVPDGNGGTYQLAADEGLFVYTPHDTLTRYFHVTRNSDTVLSSSNRTAQPLAVAFDPATSAVGCHVQLTGITGQGFPYTVYAMWADGREDPEDARPGFPVMANPAKNGAPHLFAVFRPQGGLPPGPRPAVVCLHGGGPEGSYWSYAPNSGHYRNTGNAPTDGYTITFDDRLFLSANGIVSEDRPTNWFGWHTQLNATIPGNAPANALVVPYTLRRLLWTIDWLIKSPTHPIDSNRIAIMGISMGGTGTLLLSRWKPERFSAATAFVPPHYTPETGSRLFGNTTSNLLTTETGPNGPLRVNDFFDPSARISPTQRDYCLTRIYRGRCDDAAEWGPQHLKLFNDLNDKGLGIHLYWDHRDHTASDWTADDPRTSCPDIGQWVSPVRTQRSEASYQSRFRNNQSYPGIFHDDQRPDLAGRQPLLGNGDPANGDAWGTWSGYYDWDVNTIIDTTNRWECTLFLTGQSTVSVDNCPRDSASCSLAIRKPARFRPPPQTSLQWRLVRHANGQVLQSGSTSPDASGLVTITGLKLYKDPVRTRLIVETDAVTSIADRDGDNVVINIYPNPANQKVHLHGPGFQEFEYAILDARGSTVMTGRTRGRTLDVGRLPAGSYLVKLRNPSGILHHRKLVVRH